MKDSSQEPQLAYASPEITRAAALRAHELFAENLCALSKLADRMFAWLTGLELLTAIVFAVWISPHAWDADYGHVYVWPTVFLAGLISGSTILLVRSRSGDTLTRHYIAVSQILVAGLLIHLCCGRTESNFVVLCLVAFLAFYRDWKVLVTATLVTALDHLIRGAFCPYSMYGALSASPWRAAEHTSWILFEVMFLSHFIQYSRNEAWLQAQRHAKLEGVKDKISLEVAARTSDLTKEIDERIKAETRLHLQNEVSALLGTDAPVEYICQHTLRVIAETFEWKWGSVWEINPHILVMRMTDSWTERDNLRDFETISRSTLLHLGEGVPGGVWAGGDCHWLSELPIDPTQPRLEAARTAGLGSAFAFPVLQEYEVVAVFEFWSEQIQQPERDLIETFTAMGRAIGSYLAHKQDERAIRESERRYRLMFDSNPHPMWVYDLENLRFLAVNQSAIRKYGYSAEEFHKMTILDIYPPAEARELLKNIPLVPNDSGEPVQLQHLTREGNLIDVEMTSHTIDWKSRAADLVLANDVTERKRAQSEKAIMEVQLRQAQKLESIGQLAAGIAHEINTPTQYIGDNARFLKDAFEDFTSLLTRYDQLLKLSEAQEIPREVVEQLASEIRATDTDYLLREIPNAIQQSIEGVERVSTLVAAMKEFSHPGTKEKTPLNLNKSIESTITVARNEWKYVAELETDYDPDLPLISCLPGEFNQVILNLVVNAAHAIGEATGNGSQGKGLITVRTRDYADWVEIQIADSGTGIPEKARARIFDPFFTTKEIGRGTGQGLAIAYAVIVDKHGGSITFETEMGQGTTFTILLPHDGRALPSRTVVA
jgi:two-component system, NtrC family, sensor kinase